MCRKKVEIVVGCVLIMTAIWYTAQVGIRRAFHNMSGFTRVSSNFKPPLSADAEVLETEILTSLNSLQKRHIDKRYLIYKCDGSYLCGGWADRQKGIVTAYLLSLLTNRTFGIFHPSPCSLSNLFLPNHINWNINVTSLRRQPMRLQNAVDDFAFRQNLPNTDLKSFYREETIFFTANQDYVTEIRRHGDSARILPWLYRTQNSEVYRIILKEMFMLNQELQNEIDRFFSTKVNRRQLVCAHVRLGRNPTMLQDGRKRLEMGDLKNLWEFLRLYNHTDYYKIFVASDSQEVTEYSKLAFPKQIVDIPGTITHLDRTKTGDRCAGFKKAALEQTILSRCDVLVLTSSGFGTLAAFMRGSSADLFCYHKHQVVRCSSAILKLDLKVAL